MRTNIPDNLIHIIILDISGIYAQIHNQGYFDEESVKEIKKQYSGEKHWKIIELEN